MKTRANEFDLKDAERFDNNTSVIFNCKDGYCLPYQNANVAKNNQFTFLIVVSFLIKQAITVLAVENDASVVVETFCILEINFVGTCFHAFRIIFFQIFNAKI